MTKTENLQLPQWEAEDYVQRSDFNDAFQALDEGYALAIGSASKAWEASADKVTQEALAQLQTVVDTKAGQEDLTALTAQHDSDLADVQAALALRGNCQIIYGTYTGTGTTNKSGATAISFNHPPILVLVEGYLFYKYKTKDATSSSKALTVTFTNSKVSWYSTTTADEQLNAEGTTYSYIALVDISQ
jgi:hypothetical protein